MGSVRVRDSVREVVATYTIDEGRMEPSSEVSISGRRMLTRDLKGLRNVTFVSTSFTDPTTNFPNLPAEPARRSSTLLVCINGSVPATNPAVLFAETYFKNAF